MQISKHSPESCPIYNERFKGSTVALIQKLDVLTAKHGVKMISSFTDHPAHMIFNTYEAPNMESFMAFSMEPEMMAWLAFHTVSTRVVVDLDQIKKMFGI